MNTLHYEATRPMDHFNRHFLGCTAFGDLGIRVQNTAFRLFNPIVKLAL